MADPHAAPSFLRATAQRAGHLVLAPPRLALDALTRALPDALRPAFITTAPGTTAAGTLARGNLGDHAPASASAPAPASASASTTTAASPGMALPSPVTYLTSPYLFTSLALAFFLHRIHHLVPPRTSLVAHSTLAHPRVMRPAVQVGLRLPGLLLMLRTALALACALALHAGHPLDWLSRAHSPSPDARTVAATLARSACTLVTWSTAWAGRGALGRVLAAASPADLVAALDHHALLWATYVAASVGLTCETFVRALSDDLPNVQHFNLLSFSFLLHVHSAPLRGRTTSGGGPDPSSQPEHPGSPNLYTFLLLTLLELLALQLSYCLHHLSGPSSSSPARRAPTHRSVRKYRLPITAFFSLLQQACAIRSWLRVWGYLGSGGAARATEAEEFGTVWLNKIPEILFECVVGASVGLKALAALIRGEELSFENIVGHPAMSPTSEEDYPVALVKYCTHLLSTTRLSGLAYELHPLDLLPLSIALPLEDWGLVDPPPCDDDRCPVHGDEVRAARRRAAADERPERGVTLRRNGDVVFDEHDAAGALVVAGGLRRRKNGQWAGGEDDDDDDDEEHLLQGFANEVRRITVEPHHGAAPGGSTPFAPPPPPGSSSSLAHIEGERKSHLWVLVRVCARIALYLAWRAARAVRRAGRAAAARGLGWGRDEWEMERGWRAVEGERERERDETREEREEEEEEDGEWRPEWEQDEEGSDWTSEGEEEEEEDWREEGEFGRAGSLTPDDPDLANPLALFSDLSTPSTATTATPAELAPYLLAHHLAASDAPPLTRRRYRALLPPSAPSSGPLSRASTPAAPTCRRSGTPPSSSLAPPAAASPALALSRAISSRRADVLASLAADDADAARQELEHRRERWRDERARFCVVCTVNERSVVLWPCRCLCLCEDCRASLADRTTTAGSAAAAALDGGGGGGGGGSLCPTCRSPVQAFSRIWTP